MYIQMASMKTIRTLLLELLDLVRVNYFLHRAVELTRTLQHLGLVPFKMSWVLSTLLLIESQVTGTQLVSYRRWTIEASSRSQG